MIRDILFQIKHTFSKISFKRKDKVDVRLNNSFGQLKEDSFDFELIGKYFRNKDNSKAHQVLSDKTCNDLDFEDLYTFLDRTHSKIGQQYLYNKLRTIERNEEQTKLDEIIIDVLSRDSGFRISVQKKIEKLNYKDANHVISLFQDPHVKPPKWFFIMKLLSFTSFISLILSFINPLFFIVLLGVFCVNCVIHFWNKNSLFQYVSSIPQLLNLNKVATSLYSLPLFKGLNTKLPTSIKLIDQVKSRMSLFQLEAKLQGDFQIIFWFLFEIFKTLFLIEPLFLFGVLRRLDTKRDDIEDVFKFVGHIDMLISIASLRAGIDVSCKPTVISGNGIIAHKMRHPLIYDCTPNSITMTDKSVLLTGSNMSGKTSFIRAVGLNVITGLTINTCFAEFMSFPLLRVFSAIRISDDLLNDKSYYFEEVLTIKEMIIEGEKNEKNIFLLDELFKGTNTVERISAGKAVLSALTKNNNIVVVSTHDIELTDFLAEAYELYHFSEIINKNIIDFDYKLKGGRLQNRNAIRILDINDYPKEIVNEAMAISRVLDKVYQLTKDE
jgi:acid stress-induced BolA-like protein IbaG/YrbA